MPTRLDIMTYSMTPWPLLFLVREAVKDASDLRKAFIGAPDFGWGLEGFRMNNAGELPAYETTKID
jgi:hypothetical protein